jgi:hypothetical protein
MHPSYTICAIILALHWARDSGFLPKPVKIHFSVKAGQPNPVYEEALGVSKSLANTT